MPCPIGLQSTAGGSGDGGGWGHAEERRLTVPTVLMHDPERGYCAWDFWKRASGWAHQSQVDQETHNWRRFEGVLGRCDACGEVALVRIAQSGGVNHPNCIFPFDVHFVYERCHLVCARCCLGKAVAQVLMEP